MNGQNPEKTRATHNSGVRCRKHALLRNWMMANQRIAAALKAKGYAYRYVFAEAAGHVTHQTLPGALEWLWQGYPVK